MDIVELGIICVTVPAAGAIVLYLVRKYRESTWGKCKDFRPLEGRVFLVTGANSGVGKETVKELAIRKASVILACRNLDRANATILDIRRNVATGKLIPMQVDLTSLKSVERFAQEVLRSFPKIHVLINNAGVAVPEKNNQKTEDGFEIHFGVNHLSHFLLTKLLLDRLENSAPSRVVIVSSILHESGLIDFETLNGEDDFIRQKRTRNPGYCNSKLANAYFCKELAQQTSNTGLETYALCPGICYTGLARYTEIKWYHYVLFLPFAFFFMRSASQGCQTIIHCAVSEEVKGTSGQFYRDCKPYKSAHDFKPEVGLKLWQVSEELVSTALKT